MSDFSNFAELAARPRTSAPPPEAPEYSRIALLGGGEDARLVAALCLSEGAEVVLFSAYGMELAAMRASSGISLRGAGPVGTYQIDRDGAPSVRTTAELDTAVRDAEVIFMTGPVHKQRTYAMVLADHLTDGQILVLAPGRSLGALETAWLLRIGGSTADITIVEAQGLPYWIRAEGAVLNLTEAGTPVAATLPSGREQVLAGLHRFIPSISKDSVVASGFADGSALVEFPALLMGGPALGSGAITVPVGGTPLPENRTFATLIGLEQRHVMELLAEERRTVARAYGVRDLPDIDTWTTCHAGTGRGAGARPVPDPDGAKRLLRDGVIGSLVPLESAAGLAAVDVPVTRSMIILASAVLGADVAAAGRRLDTIGIDVDDVDDARRAMDRIAMGGC